MSEPITRAELDSWLADSDAEAVVIHGFCHDTSEQLAWHLGNEVSVRCRTCNKHVINIVLEDDKVSEDRLMRVLNGTAAARLVPSCHPKHGLWITYSMGDLKVSCGGCRQQLATMRVGSSVPGSVVEQ